MSTFSLVLDKGAARELYKLLSLLRERVLCRDLEYLLLKDPEASVSRLEKKLDLVDALMDQLEDFLD